MNEVEKRLDELLNLAIKHSASDIHITLKGMKSFIEYRIKGKLYKHKSESIDLKLLKYLQYLSNLDMGNILKPQSGQFEYSLDKGLISVRFALISKLDFQTGVLRILNHNLKLDVNKLSSLKWQNDLFLSLFNKYCGLVIFSGPTGSGKTTTLYTLLNNVDKKKIYTIEDPIEQYSDKLVQLQVNEAINFDYFQAISQILRHDPDIIMIGEIRDEKAAKMAVIAANTGHLVFATLHASKASTCISRLIELGCKQSQIYENLLCIVNQKMIIVNDKKKVLYEIMDLDEIKYYKTFDENSENFLSIERQLV